MGEIEELHNRINDLELEVYKNTRWRRITQWIMILSFVSTLLIICFLYSYFKV